MSASGFFSCLFSGNGLGRDAWLFGPETITTYLCYLYVTQTLYVSVVFLTKICVALFYLRIFPVVRVRRLIWGTIGLSALGMVVFDILAIAQCQPISSYWTGWDQWHEGHCLGINPLAWSIAAVSIILDIWMLAIPIWQLVQLQMKWQRKLAVAIMITVGTFVTVVSILRLRYSMLLATLRIQPFQYMLLDAYAQGIPKTWKFRRLGPKKPLSRTLWTRSARKNSEQLAPYRDYHLPGRDESGAAGSYIEYS
ncbi:hypothetical protein F53441_10939 [Fusarium austroafricanum]|uniref:Rhodopsin domain-containing protein n=1 Tax=Fusarium austroafricanum TaxID=2364996 RepID=A0A8H4NTY5_9HYPO|nr:hypothetical protein F53441_10939 [Fusarium austroafricanum]